MVDVYLEKYKEKLHNALKEEKSGEMEMAGLAFKWTWTLQPVPLQIPDSIGGGSSEEEEEESFESDQESPFGVQSGGDLLKPIIGSLNDFLQNAMRELSVRVVWDTAYGEEDIYYVTHLLDFTYPITLPNLPGATPKQGGAP